MYRELSKEEVSEVELSLDSWFTSLSFNTKSSIFHFLNKSIEDGSLREQCKEYSKQRSSISVRHLEYKNK
jgi:hypothetical protein